MKKVLIGAISCLAVSLTGCTSTGYVEDPVVRRLSWFSFMSGDDLRSQCVVGRDHLRLIHNAKYKQDVRVIEAVGVASGGMTVSEQIYKALNLKAVVLDFENLKRPWAPDLYTSHWSKTDVSHVMEALLKDHAFTPLQGSVPLESEGYFWVGSGCSAGKFWFKAWAYPDVAYVNLKTPKVLEGLLTSGEIFAEAKPETHEYVKQDRDQKPFFSAIANQDGILGRMLAPPPPFVKFAP